MFIVIRVSSEACYSHRTKSINGVWAAVAQPSAVGSPAANAAGLRECAGVKVADGNRSDIREVQDINGHFAGDASVIAELATPVSAPTLHRRVAEQSAGRCRADGDCN
jgi:hypothetical protein